MVIYKHWWIICRQHLSSHSWLMRRMLLFNKATKFDKKWWDDIYPSFEAFSFFTWLNLFMFIIFAIYLVKNTATIDAWRKQQKPRGWWCFIHCCYCPRLDWSSCWVPHQELTLPLNFSKLIDVWSWRNAWD